MTTESSEVLRLSRMLTNMDQRLKATERSAQTGFRSVDGGAVNIYNDDGELIQKVGQLPDGSVGAADMVQTPPTMPSDPQVGAGVDQYAVDWDGGYVDEQPDEVTVGHVAIHSSPELDFEPSEETEVDGLPLLGGQVLLAGDSEVATAVRLVAVSTAGVWSEPTAAAIVTPERPPEVETTDGQRPVDPPTVTAIPGINCVYLKVVPPENPDPIVAYTVYVAGVEAKTELSTVIQMTLDGAGEPLPYDTDSSFTVSVSDGDGEGPPSPPVLARPVKIDVENFAQNFIDAFEAQGQTADEAQSAADQAVQDALDAFNAATGAQSTADAAATPADIAAAKIVILGEAATVAQNKADAAKSAAELAAASDATTKADQAKVDALTDAAVDAQNKADAARDEAKAYADDELVNVSAAAATAQSKAEGALTAAQTAQATADGAIRTFYQPDAPTGLNDDTHLGDLWFDTATNQAHRWSGSQNDGWVLIQDNSIADALAAAQSAQTTANGKITSYYRASKPTGADLSTGDLWFDTDGENKPHYYDGTDWLPVRDGYIDVAKEAAKTDAAVDATTKADAAREAAKVAASLDATAKADQAETNAAATAAQDASDKADAAKIAAEQAAKDYADQVAAGEGSGALSAAKQYAEDMADAAQSAAEIAAALDATAKANQAKSDASTDASNKANQAKDDAIAAASTDATNKADAAESAAILAAKTDATQKADAAREAAKTAASLDATAKADQAEADAKLAAAQDAQEKADAAESAAKIAAASDATGKVSQALIDAAADAQTKADNAAAIAEQAAKTAAATDADNKVAAAKLVAAQDASDKADQALLDAKADATQKADAAESAAKIAAAEDARLKVVQALVDAATEAQRVATIAKNAAESAAAGDAGAKVTQALIDAAAVAQTKADKAKNDAVAAAKVESDKKGKVIIQNAAPAAADRLPQNLWIDTTGGKNIPKKWVSGSTWTAVQDASIQAAADAAVAAQNKANSAANAATVAQETADKKNSNTFSTATDPPTVTGRKEGDIHSQLEGTKAIHQWVIESGAWVERQIDGAVLTNIDAATITTGFLNVAELIDSDAISTRQLAADIIEVNDVYSQNGIQVGGGEYEASIVINKTIGILVSDLLGNPLLSLGTGPDAQAFFGGGADLKELTVRDRMHIQGKQNEVSRDSSITLETGTTPPANSPQFSLSKHQILPLTGTAPGDAMHPEGTWSNYTPITRVQDGWVRLIGYKVGIFDQPEYRMGRLRDTGYDTYYTLPATMNGENKAWAAVMFQGYIVVGLSDTESNPVNLIHVFDSDNRLYQWFFPDNGTAYRPVLGTNDTGTLLFSASRQSDGRTTVRNHEISTGYAVMSFTTNTAITPKSLYVYKAGGNPYFMLLDEHGQVRVFNENGVEQVAQGFDPGVGGVEAAGVKSTGEAVFMGFPYYGAPATYYQRSADLSAYQWQAAYSWYDSNPSGGIHETEMGPVLSFTQPARTSMFRLTVPTQAPAAGGDPNAPDSSRLYLSKNGGPFYSQGEIAGGNGFKIFAVGDVATSGQKPMPASGRLPFPNGNAAQIVSASGGFRVDGSGIVEVPTPTVANRAANKSYVDAEASAAKNRFWHTGAPSSNVPNGNYRIMDVGDPIAAKDAVNKSYVDDRTEDSGWVNMSVQYGYTGYYGAPLQIRKIGSIAFARGLVQGTFPNNSELWVASFNSAWAPGLDLKYVATTNHTDTYSTSTVTSTGKILVRSRAYTATSIYIETSWAIG